VDEFVSASHDAKAQYAGLLPLRKRLVHGRVITFHVFRNQDWRKPP